MEASVICMVSEKDGMLTDGIASMPDSNVGFLILTASGYYYYDGEHLYITDYYNDYWMIDDYQGHIVGEVPVDYRIILQPLITEFLVREKATN